VMETILTSPTKEVHIGTDHPFVIIGERINPTGRSKLAAEMAAGNFERVRADAIAQAQAGAQVLDVNAGIPMADEPAIMAEAIRLVQSVTDLPISIDSSVIKALESGLMAVKGKALINSVTGEEERLEAVLPLAKRFGAAVIGISNDETGISQDPDVRFGVAKKIVERAEKIGIPREDVLIDPLVLPVGAVGSSGPAVFRLLRRVREELGVNTVCGASNVSFGLPDRVTLNGAFLTMAIANGLTSAITNPLEESIRKLILAANVMMGHDENCMRWLKAAREAARAEGGAGAERAARRERRRSESAG
jgi:5-methyltetrahydrofolate--homocysteine methyltransferase